MKRKLWSVCLALCLLVGMLPMAANAEEPGETYEEIQTYKCDDAGYLTYRVVTTVAEDTLAAEDTFVEICAPKGSNSSFTSMDVKGDLTVPAELDGLPVKRLGSGAFMACDSLKSIRLPDKLEVIGDGAFIGCSGLTSLTIPKSVTKIGFTPFREISCVITVEGGNPKFFSNNGMLCEKLTETEWQLLHCPGAEIQPVLDIPEGVAYISGRPAPEGNHYSEIHIPSTLVSLRAKGSHEETEDTAFEHITAANYTVADGNKNFSAKDGALYNLDGTMLVKYPRKVESEAFQLDSKVKALEKGAFFQCTFTSADLSKSGVEKLPFGAFSNCGEMQEILLPNTLKSMEPSALEYCNSLKSLALPEGFTSLANMAVTGCYSLTSVSIPKSLVKGVEGAFGGSKQVKITVASGNEKYRSEENGKVLYEKDGSGKPVALLNVSNDVTTLNLPETVTKIGNYACMDCQDLKTITFPDGLKEIGYKAFVKCPALTELSLPASVTDINETAFQSEDGQRNTFTFKEIEGNPNFSAVYGSLYTKAGTLLYVPDVNSLTVAEDTTAIAGNAAAFSQNLNSVELPSSIKTIGESAFQGCTNLATAKFPEGLTRISRRAFANTGLKEVCLPTTVIYMGTFAFENCAALERVTAPKEENNEEPAPVMLLAEIEEKSLESQTFSGCKNLVEAEVPAGITKIQKNAFEGCTSLKKVTIPQSVTTIEKDAIPANENMTIYGVLGSVAETYAKNSNFDFVGSEPKPDPDPSPDPSPDPGPVPPPSGGGDETPPEEEPGDTGVTPEDIAALQKQFSDVQGHWGEKPMAWAYKHGLFQGTSDTAFTPNGNMQRGMLALVLYRYAGQPESTGTDSFTDVSDDAYYGKAVAWAAEQGIIQGLGENRFGPTANVSREELACMLYRYAKPEDMTEKSADIKAFPDAGQTHSWAVSAMSWAVNAGILTGRSNGTLDPRGTASRAEVAAMIQRFAALAK